MQNKMKDIHSNDTTLLPCVFFLEEHKYQSQIMPMNSISGFSNWLTTVF
jgi:hypothetical protein